MEPIEARITDLAHDGAGIAKVDGKVFFVDGALPGELVRFEPRKKRRGKFQGILQQVVESSADRVDPRCGYFGICGGCAQQHIDTTAQLEYKQRILFENLRRIGKAEPAHILPPMQKSAWQYRRKARPGVRDVPKKGGILVGFRERNSSYITSLMECHTLDHRLSVLLPGLHDLISGLSCRNRVPQVEMAAADNAVALVLRHLEPLTDSDLKSLAVFAENHSVQMFLQPGGLDSVMPLWPENPEVLYYRLERYDLKLEFKPTDFIQVNGEINEAMIAQTLDLLDPAPGDSVMDLFCGLGNFTLPIARWCDRVLGVEGDRDLVERGMRNARHNGLGNAGFLLHDLHNETVDELGLKREFNKLLLDPPRSGAVEVIKHLVPNLRPEVIVYVSCNPATLSRDAGILTQVHDYRMTHAGVIDMFPHTAHVESMARFVSG